MGCDIHAFAERRTESGAYEFIELDDPPFDVRSYGLFAFLAGVRNYSDIQPLAEIRGCPDDASDYVKVERDDWEYDGHSHSWLSIDELLAFDYDSFTEDRRVTQRMPGGWIDCAATADPGDGKQTTYRNFLGQWFFEELNRLKESKVDRVVFWFDN